MVLFFEDFFIMISLHKECSYWYWIIKKYCCCYWRNSKI